MHRETASVSGMTSSEQPRAKMNAARFIGLSLLLLAATLAAASATSVLLVDAARAIGGEFADFMLEKGPEKVLRRCLMGWGFVALWIAVRRAGWRGWRDCGWTAERGADPDGLSRLQRILRGAVIALLSMGVLRAVTLAMGAHSWTPMEMGTAGRIAMVARFFAAAVIVAVVEETAVRGILYRVLARVAGIWPAALVSSVLFAVAHYINPDSASFDGVGFWSRTLAVLQSTAASAALYTTPWNWFSMLNLALMGVMLCAMQQRTGSIWMCVGAHACWVFIIQTFHFFSDYAVAFPWNFLLAKHANATDGLMTTLMLLAILAWLGAGRHRGECRVRLGGAAWRMMPENRREFELWLERNRQSFPHGGLPYKTYPGCRVALLDGLVVKAYTWPGGIASAHFALRPSRVLKAAAAALDLRARGLPVAEPVAWAVVRYAGLRRFEYLVTREIRDALPLTRILKTAGVRQDTRRAVLAEYARLAAAFHAQGYSNRDLKDENVLVENGRPERMWVVDLDGVRYKGRVSMRRARKDLYRAGKSLEANGWTRPEDVCAFFEAYNAAAPTRLQANAFPA